MSIVKNMATLTLLLSLLLTVSCGEKKTVGTKTSADTSATKVKVFSAEKNEYIWVEKVKKSDEEWKKQLEPLSYEVTREQGTERAFTGKYEKNHAKGIYSCICCGNDLFTSDTKFESGTGWPSFWQPIA